MATFNESHQTIFMKNIYTVTSSFRHTLEIERALQNASRDKHATKAHIIYCCLTGQENLNRYLDEFTEEDLQWIYEQKLKICRDKKNKDAALKAVAEHEKIDEDYERTING